MSASAMAAVASMSGLGFGVATITSRTPATRAVTAVMRSVEGRGKRPAGA
jgi:hypothetical protein